jgi:imidazoleglycerol-phosphate dehydratase
MDEALILSAVDFSGRGYFAYELDIKRDKVGDFDTELCAEFWQAFATNAGATLHLRQMAGNNAHHIIEGTFKSCAVSIRRALTVDERFKNDIPSTKGVL